MKTFLLTATMVVAFMLAGCASVKSIENPESNQVSGLAYYMPKKDFLISFTVLSVTVSKVDIKESSAYPDMSMRYVMKFQRNFFGDNTLSVRINANGLLSSLGYRYVSRVRELVKKVGGDLLSVRRTLDSLAFEPQCPDGKYTLLVPASDAESDSLCGITVTVSVHKYPSKKGGSGIEHREVSGIFYRQEIPYEVKVSYGGVTISKILFSPSESEVHFMPAPKSFLKDSNVNYVFNDGVLIQYSHEAILNL